MSFATFELPQWVEGKGPDAVHNLAGSASPARSIKGLIDMSTDAPTTTSNLDFMNLSLNYNPHGTGSASLKANLAASVFTTPVAANDILTTTGTSQANQIVLQALLQPGDHVICVHPVYAQLYNIPRAVGAHVSFWRHRPGRKWQLEFEELEALVRDRTRMIIVNNPNNPTGTYLKDDLSRRVVGLAQKHGLIVLADEIFRPLFHFSSSPETSTAEQRSDDDTTTTAIPKSFLDHAHDLGYSNVIVTGSVSKSYSFPGVRVGWIISRSPTLLSACSNVRLLSLISASQIDETIAAEALSPRCRAQIVRSNLQTAHDGLALLEQFINSVFAGGRYRAEWIKPLASSTTLIRFINLHTNLPLDDVRLCRSAFDREKLLLVPASLCFDMLDPDTDTDAAVHDGASVTHASDMRGWIRVSFVVDQDRLGDALAVLKRFLDGYVEDESEDAEEGSTSTSTSKL